MERIPAPTITPGGPFPVGIYVPEGNPVPGDQIQFRSDGTYTRTVPKEHVVIRGRYVVSQNQIVLNDDLCAGFTGTYIWGFDGQVLTFQNVEDKCNLPRKTDMQRQWIRQP
jgi:signal peptidase I